MNAQHIARLQSKLEPTGLSSLFEIGGMSCAEFRKRVRGVLSGHEARLVHRAARHEKQENLLYKSRLLTRANPLLKNAVRLGITPVHAGQYSYQDMFGGRSSQYVKPGSVASMFSPAAYLTELYREARALRDDTSVYHIDVRRPDLQHLLLTQQNLDEELSVLSLSNELLMEGIKHHDSFSEDLQVLEHLSVWRPTGATPYHDGFERMRQAVLAQGGFRAVMETAPEVSALMAETSLLGMNSGLSPEVYAILAENITEQTMEELYSRNFGEMMPQSLMTIQALSQYYSVDYEILEYFVAAIEARASVDSYTDIPQKRFLLEINKWVRLYHATTLVPQALSRVMDVNYSVGLVNSYTAAAQGSDYGFALSDGGWVVLWNSNGQDGSAYGVYQKRYSANGLPLSGDVLVNTTVMNSECRPNGALLADGGWVVSWENLNNPVIYQQRFDASGMPIGTETQLTNDSDVNYNSAVTGLPDGGWVVTWHGSITGSTTGNEIYQQRFDRDGGAVGLTEQVNTVTTDNQVTEQSKHIIAGLVDGGWVIVWTSNAQDGNGQGVFFQRFAVDGTRAGVETQVNTFINSNQNQPCLSATRDGGWVIVWTSNSQDSSGTGIYLQRYDNAGLPVGNEQLVNTTVTGEQNWPAVSALADGGCIVTWSSADSNSFGIYQQRFDADGAPVDGEVRINPYETNNQNYPCPCALTDGGWVVIYCSMAQDGDNWGIYQQRFSVRGKNAADINASLRRVVEMQFYMQRYSIDHEQALILCNTPISEKVYGSEPSQFDRLFNLPPLNGFVFTPDGAELNLTPGATDDPRKAVLRRAFHVDDVSLYRLLLIADPTATDGLMLNDIAHQSYLYLAWLLAEVHALSVDELAMLMAAIGEPATSLHKMSDAELRGLTDRLHCAVTWLQARKWSVSDLFVMTTTGYSTTLTPDIQNFLDALNGGLNGTNANGDTLITLMAPYVAASLRLTLGEDAESLLHWIDNLQPTGIDVDAFWALVQNNMAPTEAAIQFCHALAQLAVIYRAVSLDTRSLALLVIMPLRLVSEIVTVEGVAVAGHDADTLRQLTDYTDWLGSLEAEADGILSLLSVSPPAAVAMPPSEVARAMGRDEQLLLDAAAQALLHGQIADASTLTSWPEIAVTLQWVALADLLGISPGRVNAWLGLDYLDTDDPAGVLPVPVPYSEWSQVASTLTAGLDDTLTPTLESSLAESLSAALVSYYLYEVADATLGLKSRDDLYQYLLIDNQASAEIVTTRIAEAIASVQLYVGRTQDQVEPDVDQTVLSRPFFVDWTTYNKHYSTWSGVSQLVYYPENYIDPTLRVGQTGMMDTLSQTISQSSLTSGGVEDAFNNYLTSFEQVANLDVISGYHDHLNIDQGLTYFIGASFSEELAYYWRSVDHNLAQHGVFPANAWTDWHKIDCALDPYQNVVRPVIRNSRLHLIWLERIEQANVANGTTTTTYIHVLKLSQLRYDGTWSAPVSYLIEDYLKNLQLLEGEAPGLYCAENPELEDIQIMLYKRQADTSSAQASGFYLSPGLEVESMNEEQVQECQSHSHLQWDTDTQVRINNRYLDLGFSYSVPVYVGTNTGFEYGNFGDNYSSGNYHISKLFGGSLNDIKSGESVSSITISALVVAQFVGGNDNVDVHSKDAVSIMSRYCQGDAWCLLPEHTGSDTSLTHLVDVSTNFNPPRIIMRGHYLPPTDYYESLEYTLRSNGKPDFSFFDSNYWDPNNKSYFLVPDSTGMASGSSWISSISEYYSNSWGVTDQERYRQNYSGAGQILKAKIPVATVKMIVTVEGVVTEFTAAGITQPSHSFGSVNFPLPPITIDTSNIIFIDDYAEIQITFEASFESGHRVGREHFIIPITRISNVQNVLSLGNEESDAQYMQCGPYRVRMNTLFARQLVERAARGLDAILSLESQNLPEPSLGGGGYIKVTLPPYDIEHHGDERAVRVGLFSGEENVPDEEAYFPFISATLEESPLEQILFVPISRIANGDPVDFPVSTISQFGVYLECKMGRFNTGTLSFNPDTLELVNFVPDAAFDVARDPGIEIQPYYIEPMDFSGANALYFWELFYYTPMLVAQRLLQEQSFDEAQRWLEFVWNPAGYIVDGQLQSYQWNVRPLLEDISWNSEPLESTDPDAVAQYDPMHYKVSTFMRTVDLLIARGDEAYRQLERDSLNEAKMWYMQALYLMGAEPYVPSDADGWSEPSLDAAADLTLQHQGEEALLTLRHGLWPDTLTSSTLTGLFLPQANEIMLNYWQTLDQRLYNLRHNLSIGGQPLSLPIYASPADPVALHSAAVNSSQGFGLLPAVYLSTWRYRQIRDGAVAAVSQLIQFGSTLQSNLERQDGEALSHLLNTQAAELILISMGMQDKTLAELASERQALVHARDSACLRYDRYSKDYDENISGAEAEAMDLLMGSSILSTSSTAMQMAGAGANMVPNIYGLAVGGAVYGALLEASAYGSNVGAQAMQTTATKISQSEEYRRRRNEWQLQRDSAANEIKQIDAQLQALDLRSEGAAQQKTYLETQQQQTRAQLEFLTTKFTSQALYSWLSGRLSAIYYQLYDLTVSRCLMAQASYHQETGDITSFIKPGAWQGTYAGLSCGETLLLNMTQMEDAYLRWEQRVLEVSRTVSLSDFYNGLAEGSSFDLASEVAGMVSGTGTDSAGVMPNVLDIDADGTLSASFRLSDLQIAADYPDTLNLGSNRCIKQISVSLPALVGPYQNVQAVLSYGGTAPLSRGCNLLAVSHGMNDSGQFQLDFNDGQYLPFEGIQITDEGTLTLRFPNARGRQMELLMTLNDMIVHFNYTIR